MTRGLSAILAAAALGGCAEEAAPPIGPGVYAATTGAAVATVGNPGLPDIPFGEALVMYSRALGELHAGEGARADAPIQDQVLGLATILERMPAAAAQPGLRHAAGLMRAAQEAAGPRPSVEVTKRSLAVAAGALLGLAKRGYGEEPEIATEARAFAGAVSAIDARREPPDRAAVIAALMRAESVLAAMYAANAR